MSLLSDEQLELLESYIDGELPAEDEDALRRRLETEPALAGALEGLRSERDVRMQVWASYEPTQASVQRVVAHVGQRIDQHNAWAYRLSHWRVPLATAACILIGFGVGWIGRGSSPQGAVSNGGGPSRG